MLRAPTRTSSGPGSKHPSERSECRPCRQRLAAVHGLLVVLSGPADAMICTAAASQSRDEYQTKKQRHSARPVSHARSETRGQLPRHRYLLRAEMLVILSVFKTGLDASGHDELRTQTSLGCV
jgi:hypothetical protein